jgi:hypothetical protein
MSDDGLTVKEAVERCEAVYPLADGDPGRSPAVRLPAVRGFMSTSRTTRRIIEHILHETIGVGLLLV